jgi:FtsP/CotA-like multicopper oxidase with cupredoxin domain
MLNRRQFLAMGVVAGGAVQAALPFTGIAKAGRKAPALVGSGASASVPPFSVRMPVPATLRPVAQLSSADVYQLALRPATVEIFPGLATPVLTYGGSYVGPTIRARAGRRVIVKYRNQLTMPANSHLHGGHVAPLHDGHPMDLIQPGQSRTMEYPNAQRAATLWYHDHTHMMEAEHVYRGLHGFYLIEDRTERELRLPGGQYDVPIMISEAHVLDDGSLFWDLPDGPNRTVLANGRPVPYFPVAARKYRLRLLNGTPSMHLHMHLEGGGRFTQIGSDGGLLPAPVPLSEVVLTSGERMDVVVDFSAYPVGSSVVLADAVRGPVLRFDVTRTADDASQVPAVLRPVPAQPPVVAERDLVLRIDPNTFQGLINDKTFDAERVDLRVKRGTSEIWRITNNDTNVGPPGGVHHNFHTHLSQFRVLDRDGGPPLPEETGLKDTVRIDPGKSVRIQISFEKFVGRYVYHCHILEHSAMGMMGTMEVTP